MDLRVVLGCPVGSDEDETIGRPVRPGRVRRDAGADDDAVVGRLGRQEVDKADEALSEYLKVAVLYAVAYLLMMQVLRFMDMLQHDYPYNLTLFRYEQPPHRGDYEWEQRHTFSNPVSLRFEKLNWLTLNFGFHNVHHADSNLPWYRLPEKHRELTGGDPESVIPLASQLRLYHRNRIRRVYNPEPEDYPKGGRYLQSAREGVGPVGGNAASFLTSF